MTLTDVDLQSKIARFFNFKILDGMNIQKYLLFEV